MPTFMDYILLAIAIINIGLLIYLLLNNKKSENAFDYEKINNSLDGKFSNLRLELDSKMTNSLSTFSQSLTSILEGQSQKQTEKLDLLINTLNEQLVNFQKSVQYSTNQTETKLKEIKETVDKTLTSLTDKLTNQLLNLSTKQTEKLDLLIKTLTDQLEIFQKAVDNNTQQTELKLKDIRDTVERTLTSLKEDNNVQLEKMRQTVDEKLQKTLNERLTQSFNIVTENLNQVSKGLGEMKELAEGVGDLKKVLSNVKTRGIFGENQLGNIIEELLYPNQYVKNYATKKGSRDPVEYAIKLPGQGKDEFVYLPIDAKFPLNTYHNLLDAQESGNKDEIEKATKELTSRIKSFAKDIKNKYIDVPNTTEFGIMFLPIEGLYAEVVKSGVTEDIQRDYRINVAGPSTMAALLNSLQMGFRTLAIQERSSEISKILGAVKTEFSKFEGTLKKTQEKLDSASKELESLVGTRTRQINRALAKVDKDDTYSIEQIDEITV